MPRLNLAKTAKICSAEKMETEFGGEYPTYHDYFIKWEAQELLCAGQLRQR
ncbi:hypothetical protein ACI01nite_14860 [Acetobacter cibinongensis]|uniref:Uncharacterized protein n=1 Tax=Acetobacter cibinongensis TaxID=146475 RepID=A0A0D6MZW1_9PROT|nr:hypothetical protein Abci_001_036 [Acetobacter cibinongensis]GBQ19817.1 hypothetical protein AA0482_2682 [Acetobacter cibinongensis NRIC 0482]GEL58884.1 hypothetical protein ACI01nite_14860 [Acetobacter cibinongensis]